MTYKNDKLNPLTGTLQDGDAAMYGGTPVEVDTGRVVAKGIPLEKVRADLRQPRRAIPASVRLYWDGTQAGVDDMLGAWMDIAVAAGGPLDVVGMLKGRGDGVELEGKPAIYEQFVELVRLAADIHRVGLSNPINVVEQAGSYVIESGERRWLAYNMLAVALDDAKYRRIPAFVQDGTNFVWRQASENTQRRILTAIGMARQYALLVMEVRRGVDGQTYDEWDDLVVPGGCDRIFYAQVANGNIHRVPKGMGERIQQAMGLSKSQLSRYRDLLRLTDNNEVNDALWTRADVEDWPARTLHEIADRLHVRNLSEIISREDWTFDDIQKAMDEENMRLVNEALDRHTEQRQADTRPAEQPVSQPAALPERPRRPFDPVDDDGQREMMSAAEIVERSTGRYVAEPPDVDYDIELSPGFYNGAFVSVVRDALVYYWERNRLKLHGESLEAGTVVTFLEGFEHEGKYYAEVWPHESGDREARFIVRMKVLVPVERRSANPYQVGDVVDVAGKRCRVSKVDGDLVYVKGYDWGTPYGKFYHDKVQRVDLEQPSDKVDSVRPAAPEVPELVNDLLRFMIQSRRMEATATQLKHEAWKYADYDYADALHEFREFHEAAADLLADALVELRRYLDAVSGITRLPGDDDV